MNDGYYTLKGYAMLEKKEITYAMEDYLEMIYRLCKANESARISELSRYLNVKPSSATKMVKNLKECGLVEFERYGHISLTPYGRDKGEYYIYRHNVLNKLFMAINKSRSELETVEKIEHFINEETVRNIELFLEKIPL